MRIKLVFNFWEENCPELSEGKFHAGTTFDGAICLNNEDAAELTAAIKQGYTPVFEVCLSDGEGGVMIGKNQCEHGQLARSCEICELKSEIAELRKERRVNAIDGQCAIDEAYNRIAELEFENKRLSTKVLAGQQAVDALKKIVKIIPLSKDGKEYLTDCDSCIKMADIAYDGLENKK